MYAMVIPVAQVIDDRSVPVNPALVFMDGDWAPAALPRLMMNRPYQHLSVWITPPKILAKMINEAGPLDTLVIQALGKKLDQLFLPALSPQPTRARASQVRDEGKTRTDWEYGRASKDKERASDPLGNHIFVSAEIGVPKEPDSRSKFGGST